MRLMEQLDYNLLFRWFVGLNLDDPLWDPTVFTRNRQRLLAGDVAAAFLALVVEQTRRRGLLSGEHFTADGTLLEAWASLESFKRQGLLAPPPDDPGNPTVNFHGERRSNDTHASTTDPEARLARQGRAEKPSWPTPGTPSSTTAMAWSSPPRSRRPPGPPSARRASKWRARSRQARRWAPTKAMRPGHSWRPCAASG